MTRNRFNQAKHQWVSMSGGQSGHPLLGSTSTNNLTLSKARGLFLEDNNIDMKDTYKITNVHPPIDEKDVVNKEYCDNKLLSSNNKKVILSKNITELRKGEFDKVRTKTLQLNETRVNDELINEFIESANEVTNTVKFCNKVAADTISKYSQLKQEFVNNKFNQNITKIHLDDMFTSGLREMKECNKTLRKVLVQYIIAILSRGTLVDNKEQARLEMHYGFKQEDIMKEIERIFTNENKQSYDGVHDQFNSTEWEITISRFVFSIRTINK